MAILNVRYLNCEMGVGTPWNHSAYKGGVYKFHIPLAGGRDYLQIYGG